MAYRQPAFMVDTALASLSISSIVARNASALSDASKRALVDHRAGPAGSIVATGANAGVQFDTGVISAKPYNRALIAKGHNLAGETVRVISDTTNGMATPTVHDSETGPSSIAPIDFSFAAGSSDRYWGFEVTTSSAETFLVGEFALGIYAQLSAEAAVSPDWANEFEDVTAEQRFGSRDALLVLSPPRRRLTLRVANVVAGSADALVLDEVAEMGRERPFWYWPPDDTLPPVLVMLSSAATVRQDFPAPSVSIRYRYDFAMREQLT